MLLTPFFDKFLFIIFIVNFHIKNEIKSKILNILFIIILRFLIILENLVSCMSSYFLDPWLTHCRVIHSYHIGIEITLVVEIELISRRFVGFLFLELKFFCLLFIQFRTIAVFKFLIIIIFLLLDI